MRPRIKIPFYSTILIKSNIPIKFSQTVKRSSFTSYEHIGRFRDKTFTSNKVIILTRINLQQTTLT